LVVEPLSITPCGSQRAGVTLNFIQPGTPVQNAFVESFNGRFRDACLNEHWFTSLNDARWAVEAWRRHYNEERPHGALGCKPPPVFARPAGALELFGGSARCPIRDRDHVLLTQGLTP
jgi:hypothetical protein